MNIKLITQKSKAIILINAVIDELEEKPCNEYDHHLCIDDLRDALEIIKKEL